MMLRESIVFLIVISVLLNCANCNDVIVEDTIFFEDLGLTNFYHNFTRKFEFLDDLSDGCKSQIKEVIRTLKEPGEKPMWVMRLLDATAKLQSGILEGNFYNLGSYDECLKVDNKNSDLPIKGKYCLGSLHLEGLVPRLPRFRSYWSTLPLPIFWALCLPDMCTNDDLLVLTEAQDDRVVFDFSSPVCSTVETNKVVLNAGDISYITVLSIISLLIILCTLYDLHYVMIKKEAKTPLFKSFSVITNGRKLFSTTSSSDQLQCMSGIRSISMMWIVLAHLFVMTNIGPVSNLTFIQEFFANGWTMYIRGGTVSVDTFFLMSGIVMIYVFLKSPKTKFNVPMYYLHRYLRLTPALAAMVFFQSTIMKYLASGPVWNALAEIGSENCDTYWWSALLYIQNYVNPINICVGQSWYLSADMQLFLVSPLILIPLRKWKGWTLIMVAIVACASVACGFALAWIYEMMDTNSLLSDPTSNYMKMYYIQPYTRAAPWLIGCIIGFYIHEYKIVKKNFEISRITNLTLWAVSLAVLATCVFVDKSAHEYDRLDRSFYISCVRPAWAIAVGWIIFSCVMGYGGAINTFLSLPIFQVLAKLTYSMYLTHMIFESMLIVSTKEVRSFTTLSKNFEFWSFYVTIVFISIVWTLAFESPIIILEKSLLGRRKPTANGTKKDIETVLETDEKSISDISTGYYDNKSFENDYPIIPRVNPKLLKKYNGI